MSPKHFRTTIIEELKTETYTLDQIDRFENEITTITEKDGVTVITLSKEFREETTKIEEVITTSTITITSEADLKDLPKQLENIEFASVAPVIKDLVKAGVLHLIKSFFRGKRRDRKISSCKKKCLRNLNTIYDLHLKITEKVKKKLQKRHSTSKKRKFRRCKRQKKMLNKAYREETKGLKRGIRRALNNYTRLMTKEYCKKDESKKDEAKI